jgi:beta-phosphoglucomutase-like phosphatase (HAD superfamily)
MSVLQSFSGTPAFVFDLNGTLVDSVFQHVLAWRYALEEAGLPLAVRAP